MVGYRLSEKAIGDLGRLYEFGIERFGLEQADRYYEGLVVRFQLIARNPQLAPAVEHIYPGLRRSVYFSHSIYYLIDASSIQIVRILRREVTVPFVGDGLPTYPIFSDRGSGLFGFVARGCPASHGGGLVT